MIIVNAASVTQINYLSQKTGVQLIKAGSYIAKKITESIKFLTSLLVQVKWDILI